MSLNLIFLDVDGVLNSEGFLCDQRAERLVETRRDRVAIYTSMVDPVAVSKLRRLVETTDAYIVVSSTWRKASPDSDGVPMEALCDQLVAGGIPESRVLGSTPHGGNMSCRGDEIHHWLKHFDQDVKSYVILDDDSDMLYNQRNNFVQTDGRLGLTVADVDRAIYILLYS